MTLTFTSTWIPIAIPDTVANADGGARGAGGGRSVFLAAARSVGGLCWLRNDGDFIIDLQRLQDRLVFGSRSGGGCGRVLFVHNTLGHDAVGRVHVTFKLFVHAERGSANSALVR